MDGILEKLPVAHQRVFKNLLLQMRDANEEDKARIGCYYRGYAGALLDAKIIDYDDYMVLTEVTKK